MWCIDLSFNLTYNVKKEKKQEIRIYHFVFSFLTSNRRCCICLTGGELYHSLLHLSTWGFSFFSKVSLSDHISGLLTVTLQAKPSGCLTFLKAPSQPHEEKEGIPYCSVKRKERVLWACVRSRPTASLYTLLHTHTHTCKFEWAKKGGIGIIIRTALGPE